ncbi:MAG TPA: GNAT family N-acetyltransferase [Phototrophicaceae bacterium]|nr:GNAT family N-acetyltransferase [Phototrophicaceae bacterium]
MPYQIRSIDDEENYWRLRAFLREVFLCNHRQELSWQAARLDYWRYFINPLNDHYPLSQAIHIFETANGTIAGALTVDGRSNAFLNVHPNLRTPELEQAMLETAENQLAEPDSDGLHHLTVWAAQNDALRIQMLQKYGYQKGGWPEHQYGRDLSRPIVESAPVSGYVVRSLGDKDEVPTRAWVSWKAFHPDEPNENYLGWEWYQDIQRCPLYRRDLDLVTIAPGGEMAAFCTIWYDDVTRTGMFEPVGTSPTHQRKGLGKQIMREGLRRLQQLGAIHATVAGYSVAANALYTSMMSSPYSLFERWHRQF